MKEEYNYITMIERSQLILKYLYEIDEPQGVSEISQELDLPKATVYRILVTLLKGGYVRKEEDKYKLGKIFIKYGEKVKDEIDLHSLAKPYMEDLAEETNETINLSIDYEDQALILERIEGEKTSLVAKLIAIAPYYCSSSGKIMLSYKDDKYIKNYFKKERKKRTIYTIDNYDDFKKEAEKIKKNGYSIDNEEYDYGLYCIAYPIFDSKGKLYGGVSISGPKSRINYKGVEKLQKALKEKVKQINEEIKSTGIHE